VPTTNAHNLSGDPFQSLIRARLLGPAQGAPDPAAAQHSRLGTGIGVHDASLARSHSVFPVAQQDAPPIR
jgi:hypothetical protein